MDFSRITGIFAGILKKIKGVLTGIPSVFSKVPGMLRGIKLPKTEHTDEKIHAPDVSGIQGKIKSKLEGLKDFFDRVLDHVPEEKRKPLIIGVGGLAGLFIVLLIAAMAMNSGKKEKSRPSVMAAGLVIPHEELFIPEEPDFVPEFLFEREPRRSWSVDDISPFWKAPDTSGRWMEEIKAAVDKLMEGVP